VVRTLENPGEGCKKVMENPEGRVKKIAGGGGGVIRNQNPGDDLRLKTFSRGIWQ
jgi:hypothetical protein